MATTTLPTGARWVEPGRLRVGYVAPWHAVGFVGLAGLASTMGGVSARAGHTVLPEIIGWVFAAAFVLLAAWVSAGWEELHVEGDRVIVTLGWGFRMLNSVELRRSDVTGVDPVRRGVIIRWRTGSRVFAAWSGHGETERAMLAAQLRTLLGLPR